MSVSILKFVLFSIIICSFGCGKNELYFISERNIHLERNVINFKNNRILADADNQFDLNDFYQSTLSLANQFNDYNDDDEEMIRLRNIINSHMTKHKESNTLPNLNNVDKKTKKLIHKIQKEINEARKELDNKRNDELSIQPVQDKRIIKIHENILETDNDKFLNEYIKISSNNCYKKFKKNSEYKKSKKYIIIKMMLLIIAFFAIIASGQLAFLIIYPICAPSIFLSCWELNKDRYEL
ncbi:Protein of unknown function (DUF2031), putative [Plasmodium chabaudi adami]|uniref:Fam-b protein n=1 Tax=Plasmodium chabaudi adami TaxID=5826 RepID=A0A1D3LAY3_PLACE|nr:Protein of unknown function (DUF2031), putative [Plasmodium chabaudi adami]